MSDTNGEKAIALVRRMLDPDDFGFVVNPEIRDACRQVLGYAPVETINRRPVIPQPRASRGVVECPRVELGQPRLHSFIESMTNVAIGYGVALASQLVIFPQFGIHVPLSTNIEIGLWFTAVSVMRSYVIRRWFNGFGRVV